MLCLEHEEKRKRKEKFFFKKNLPFLNSINFSHIFFLNYFPFPSSHIVDFNEDNIFLHKIMDRLKLEFDGISFKKYRTQNHLRITELLS